MSVHERESIHTREAGRPTTSRQPSGSRAGFIIVPRTALRCLEVIVSSWSSSSSVWRRIVCVIVGRLLVRFKCLLLLFFLSLFLCFLPFFIDVLRSLRVVIGIIICIFCWASSRMVLHIPFSLPFRLPHYHPHLPHHFGLSSRRFSSLLS